LRRASLGGAGAGTSTVKAAGFSLRIGGRAVRSRCSPAAPLREGGLGDRRVDGGVGSGGGSPSGGRLRVGVSYIEHLFEIWDVVERAPNLMLPPP
jgi:hypothetical protein